MSWLTSCCAAPDVQAPVAQAPVAQAAVAQAPTGSAQAPVAKAAAPMPDLKPVQKAAPAKAKVKVWIIYYSMYGHIKSMIEEVKKGCEEVEGVEATIYQVPEILPADVLEKMHAPPKADYPIIDPHTLPDADAFVFGFPTRFGMMCSQMKAFFDATGQHWSSGALVGKAASMIVSTAIQGGGQETSIMTAVTQLAHHGMIYVPAGATSGAGMFDVENVHGGSAWGAGCIAGPTGARQPSEFELHSAKNTGKQLATVAKKLKA